MMAGHFSYDKFLQDLQELRDLPKMSRDELEWRYTYRKQKEQRDYKDSNTASMKQQTRDFENRIADLELEREDFEKHLRHATSKEQVLIKQADRYFKNIVQLMEDNAYYEHLLRNSSKRTVISTRRDFDFQRDHAVKLSEQLHNSQIEARNSKQQLSFATSTVNQLHDENRSLSGEVEFLRDQNANLHDKVGHLHAEATSLCDGREDAEESRADQRQEIGLLLQEAAAHEIEQAQLKAELEFLKFGTLNGEGPRSTFA